MLDQLHPARDSLVLFRQSPGRAFEHGRRWIHDRDLVASECERNALVPGSATDIDHTLGRTAHVLSQVDLRFMHTRSAIPQHGDAQVGGRLGGVPHQASRRG
jgi:hypothetical protein